MFHGKARLGANIAGCSHAIHDRHFNVEQYHIVSVQLGFFKRQFAVFHGFDIKTHAFQQGRCDDAGCCLILGIENAMLLAIGTVKRLVCFPLKLMQLRQTCLLLNSLRIQARAAILAES